MQSNNEKKICKGCYYENKYHGKWPDHTCQPQNEATVKEENLFTLHKPAIIDRIGYMKFSLDFNVNSHDNP